VGICITSCWDAHVSGYQQPTGYRI
jgi:hypothetical protein